MTISATTDDPTTAKVTTIAGMLLMGDALAGEGGAGLSAAESGAVIGFTQGTLNSANLGRGVKQGVISGVTAYAVSEIEHGGENGASEFTTAEQLALQGLAGGISTELRGGKFQDGFVSVIVSKGVDLGLEGQQLDFYTEGTIAMITGGLAAKAGGGSFEDGAVQAGMVFLYNNRGRGNIRDSYNRITGRKDYLGRNRGQQARERHLLRENQYRQWNFFNNFRSDPLTPHMREFQNMLENLPDLRDSYIPIPNELYIDKQGLCLPNTSK
ncbi:hypothetical protein [uncultured Gammaproteobacteria bacterium]|nr:hypothetical protein [uncultured Gammaproteobacteria bacterium]CAC9611428.1 hypothetical protein [uncultured Gammaproteobacteria bacterium]